MSVKVREISQGAYKMDCKLMLQSTFDWAKKGMISGGEFPSYATVFATVTIHHALARANQHSDVVWYSNGALTVAIKDGKEVLTANLPAWINKINNSLIPAKSDDREINLPIATLFATTPELGLLLTVDHGGLVTVGKLIKGKLMDGLPPATFQASCDQELLTGIVNVAGDAICTVSFSCGSSLR
jgi:hypothetical protein